MTHITSKRPEHKRFQLERICGNCLEKLGIHNMGGGYAVIDQNADFKVGDVVHCLKHGQNIGGYLKQVKRIEGDSVIVGTAYYDESENYEFEAGEILGTVLETFGGFGNYREYVRPTHLRKKKLRELSRRFEMIHQLKTEAETMPKDNVNHPAHYETGKFECIDVMREALGTEAVKDFCLCNAFKYIYRHKRKNGIEDIKKAQWYINKYLEISEEEVHNDNQENSGVMQEEANCENV